MQRHHMYLSVLTAIAITTVITMASLRHQDAQAGGDSPNRQQISTPNKDEWPLADYENVEQIDERTRAVREARNNRYNNSLFGVRGAVETARKDIAVVLTEDWEEGVPPLPTSQSSVVLVGTVLDAKGYVSADRSGVYSEFPVRVDEVLKVDGAAQVNPGDVLTVQRAGGRVKGRSASILFRIRGQNMPRRGGQYAMFLQRLDWAEDYNLITGYELRGEKVVPLDSVDKFAPYSTWTRTAFLQAVREAIARP